MGSILDYFFGSSPPPLDPSIQCVKCETLLAVDYDKGTTYCPVCNPREVIADEITEDDFEDSNSEEEPMPDLKSQDDMRLVQITSEEFHTLQKCQQAIIYIQGYLAATGNLDEVDDDISSYADNLAEEIRTQLSR